jgi:hypothetical protein
MGVRGLVMEMDSWRVHGALVCFPCPWTSFDVPSPPWPYFSADPAESGRGGKRKADSSGMPSSAKRSKDAIAA